MPYVRINMVEFTSRAEAERTSATFRNDITYILSKIRSFACVETSETSTLTLSIYDDKKATDRTVARRDKHDEDKISQIYFQMKVP